MRYKASFFYASGDGNTTGGTGSGFDTDRGQSQFHRRPVQLLDAAGVQPRRDDGEFEDADSLVPDLRTSKTEGQANFVNPGVYIFGLGAEFDLTPKLRSFLNGNYIRFAETDPIKTALLTPNVSNEVGWDLSLGFQYRPLLTDNIIISTGFGVLIPGRGYRDIYQANPTPCPVSTASLGAIPTIFPIARLIAVTSDLLTMKTNLLPPGPPRMCIRQPWRRRDGSRSALPCSRKATAPVPPFPCPRICRATPPRNCRRRTGLTNRAGRRRQKIARLPANATPASRPMHASPNVVLGCTDCHGGNPTPGLTEREAHVAPRNPVFWQSSALPNDSSVLLNHESPEFIQFVNPGDLRVAEKTCGLCHGQIVQEVSHSIMRHGAMLWGAALYNNGSFPEKNYRFGQAYGLDGEPLRLESPVPVTPDMTAEHGILPYIDPLPRFEESQPGNILRIFERGQEKPLSLGNPDPFEEPGKPAHRLSDRGLGTLNRTDPVFLNLQKTRLHDPLLDFLGSNNHPGDYRSSGCSACHVVYANDRSPTDSGWYSKYGNQGFSFTGDKAIRKDERGHPIVHQFTRAIPSSQCMSCHMHQGNLFVNPYLGYTWWDEETDGELMYPAQPKKSHAEPNWSGRCENNPEAAAARGLWGNLDFLEKVAELNPKLTNTQFADYHGHGWIFRAVFNHDRQGNLLDRDGNIIPFRRRGQICQGRPPGRRASPPRNAMRGLPLRRRRPRQRPALRRIARRHDHRVH